MSAETERAKPAKWVQSRADELIVGSVTLLGAVEDISEFDKIQTRGSKATRSVVYEIAFVDLRGKRTVRRYPADQNILVRVG